MSKRRLVEVAFWLALLALAIILFTRVWWKRHAGQESGRSGPPTFAGTVEPIFLSRCIGCHGANNPKAKLRLDSYDAAMLGSAYGVVIIPGKPDQSELVRRVSLKPGEKGFMPNNKPPLTAVQIAELRQWILTGAPR